MNEHTETQFIPVPDWNKHYEWPPTGGMRHIIFHATSNGFEDAFVRVGRRILIDRKRFWEIVEQGRGVA
jgi:hypothetical protein